MIAVVSLSVRKGSPLRLGRHREHGRGGAARGGGRLLAGVGEGFPVVLSGVAGSGRSPEEGNGNPLQYSCLGNPMDTGVWWTAVHGVAKSQAQRSD